MPIFRLLPLFALAACSAERQPAASATGETAVRLECALGSGDFRSDCSRERIDREGQTEWVVRHPSGGFRILRQEDGGGGLAAADGAHEAVQSLEGDALVVSVAGDRYRFPVRAAGAD